MEKGSYLGVILRSNKTVFSFKDIGLLWNDFSPAARVRLNYYVKKGELYWIRRGFYAKSKEYDRLELAGRMYVPSYISFETVLGPAGITFQYYGKITAASYLTRVIASEGQTYSYRKIKNILLTDSRGVENKEAYAIAGKERAFLDVLYINKDYYFDNLRPLDWDKIFEILPIYKNKRMEKRAKEIYKEFKDNQ